MLKPAKRDCVPALPGMIDAPDPVMVALRMASKCAKLDIPESYPHLGRWLAAVSARSGAKS